MAAFHVRDIPEETLERLRKRAERNGRSMNQEVLLILDHELGYASGDELIERLHRLRAEWTLPPGSPDPVELIREDRDRDPDWL